MANKRMIDIEREINDLFASNEFKKLALSYDGVYRDYCNPEKFQIFDDTVIESIFRGVNKKIKEFVDNDTVDMFFRNNGIYMESDYPYRRKRDIQIGRLIITECGSGGRKDNWIVRFDNEYIYHTFQVRSEQVTEHYRILDVKKKYQTSIKGMDIIVAEYKIDVMGCDIVAVEADTLNGAEYLINSGRVKIPYKRYVYEWYTCRVIDKEEPRKIELSWKLRGWICPTCHWGTSYDKKRCDFCGQRLLPPYKFMEESDNGNR